MPNKRQSRANSYGKKSGGIGTTAGSILGVLDSLPSARNEEFDPEQAPTGDNVPYKRGGLFARMTGSGVRADRQNNAAYDAWVDSKMADEEELRGAGLQRRIDKEDIEDAALGAGEEPGNWLKQRGKNKLDALKAKGAELGALFSTKTNEGEKAETEREFNAKNPQKISASMEAELDAPIVRNDVAKRGMSLAELRQLKDEEQFLASLTQKENQAGMQYDLNRRELEQREAEGKRRNVVNLGDGRVMDVETGEVMDAGGAENFKVLKKDALGNDVEVTETRNRRPGKYTIGGGTPAQGGRIKMDPSVMRSIGREMMPNESAAKDDEGRPVALTGNVGKDGNERPTNLTVQGGGGNPNGGRPPSWPSDEVRGGKLIDLEGKIRPDVIKAEKTASALSARNQSAQLPKQFEDVSEDLIREILAEDEMNADMIGFDKKRIKQKGLGGYSFAK